jgi:integrase
LIVWVRDAASRDGRHRGRIEERRGSLRVVYAGADPVTGKRVYCRENIKGSDAAAWIRAKNTLDKLLVNVNRQRPASSAPFAHVVDEWLRTSEIEDSTRAGYVNYIQRHILRPHAQRTLKERQHVREGHPHIKHERA